MSALELILPDHPEAAYTAPQAGMAARAPVIDHSQLNGRALMAADLALMSVLMLPFGAFVLAALPVFGLYTWAEMYPGFGVMSAERLRRRWLLGAPCFALLALLAPLAGLAGAVYLLLAPLAEALTRSVLHRQHLWGKPVRFAGDSLALEQNWYLGLIPAPEADTLVVMKGDKLDNAAEVYLASATGDIARLTPPANDLLQKLGNIRTRNPHAKPWKTLKRTLDIAVSAVLLVLTLPVIALAMLAICIADPGPALYAQFRRGLHGNPVKIYKLRSMYQNSAARLASILETDDQAASIWYRRFKLQPDTRVLPFIGGFIRMFSIDELPQLLNVLRGEMSLVGPRVFVDYDLEVYSPDLLKLRQSVQAGVTGLWQVSVRSDGENADKVRYDAAYVRTWSLWQDADILYRTVGAVLGGRGAR